MKKVERTIPPFCPWKLWTMRDSLAPPLAGEKFTSSLPGPSVLKSVAAY